MWPTRCNPTNTATKLVLTSWPSATRGGAPASLPVRLAVALLADRNGVIDVDLPISGSERPAI